MKKTTFNLTKATKLLQNELVKKMDIPKTAFHRRAIDYFISSGGEIHPHLKITNRADANYVKKDDIEQIYIDEKREQQLLEIAEKNDCKITILYFQALMSYCSVMAPVVFGEETIETMFRY